MSLIIASYHVPTAIGLDRKRDDEVIELAKSMGGRFVGSGSGFGHRDLEFEFDDHAKGEDFIRICRGVGLEISSED
jgi:hypothetical protein